MKLYLSSYGIGNHPRLLVNLVGPNKKTAIIMNAQDHKPASAREERYEYERQSLADLGFEPEELDLRDYFDNTKDLRSDLNQYGLLWIRGGNVFILRKAMRYSGFDSLIKEVLVADDLVYGGFSAASCVAGPTLKGYELVDDHTLTPEGYMNDTIWDGLDLIDYSVAPHYRSAHDESEAVEKTVSYFESHNMSHRTLRDGEAIIMHDTNTWLV